MVELRFVVLESKSSSLFSHLGEKGGKGNWGKRKEKWVESRPPLYFRVLTLNIGSSHKD